ncbi:vesicle coat protein [Dipodascopsis uninucleata]
MDFLLCLAHFCEIHGPTPIICTQAILDHNGPLTPGISGIPGSAGTQASNGGCESCTIKLPADDNTRIVRTQETMAIGIAGGSSSSSNGAGGNSTVGTASNNGGNTSVNGDAPSTIQIPTVTATITYLSTSNARSQERYAALRQFCVNSLSLDSNSASDRAVLFGDGQVGYAVTLFFRIRDEHARGQSRSYALICMNDRESQLQECWPIVVPALEDIARWLVSEADAHRAAQHLEAAEQQVPSVASSLTSTASTLGSSSGSRLDRIPLPVGSNATIQSLQNILAMQPNSSPDWYLRRQHEPRPRNLVDLTGKSDVFVHIHLSFAVLLSALCREISRQGIRSGFSRF